MRSPRPSFACVPPSTPDRGAHYHGLFRPTKTGSANTPQHLSHAHSCLFLLIYFFFQSSFSKQSGGSISNLGFRREGRRKGNYFRSRKVVKLLLNYKHVNMLTEITGNAIYLPGALVLFPARSFHSASTAAPHL